MPRRNRIEVKSWYEQPEAVICPICGRDIPDDQAEAHHMVPKSKGGTETTPLHRICHRQIHALFTEAELARDFFTAEAIIAHPDMQTFIRWVQKKPPGFSDAAKRSRRIR